MESIATGEEIVIVFNEPAERAIFTESSAVDLGNCLEVLKLLELVVTVMLLELDDSLTNKMDNTNCPLVVSAYTSSNVVSPLK
jgi:hypothetical protein